MPFFHSIITSVFYMCANVAFVLVFHANVMPFLCVVAFVFFLRIVIVPFLHTIILFVLFLYTIVMPFLCIFLEGTCSFALLLCFMFFLHIVVMFMCFVLVACIAPLFCNL